MYLITGGGGFIGSNVAAALDDAGDEIVVSDWLGQDALKWRNLAKRRLSDLVTPEETLMHLRARKADLRGIVHMGAISSTVETDVDLIVRNNFRASVDLWTFCAREGLPFVYASSAATYGGGEAGFLDRTDDAYLGSLRPLNPYGWSKHLFDRWVMQQVARDRPRPPRWLGLKFFNVYGPNEYHKAGQASVALQAFDQAVARGTVKLFASDRADIPHGGQQRDFVWVGDCVDVILWGLKSGDARSGLYNVGAGQARSFKDLVEIVFACLGLPPAIDYIDMPAGLKGTYQYLTCAPLDKLREAGYTGRPTSLEQGVSAYIDNFLATDDRFR